MIRTLFWLPLSLLLLASPGCHEPKEKKFITPPAAARQTLLTLYPRVIADSARWEWDRDGYFEAHFRLDGLPHRFRVDSTGRYLETEIEVARRSLPPAVQDSLQVEIDRYHDPQRFRVRQASTVRYADGHTEYEIQVRADGKWHKRYYDDKGNLLRESKARKR